MFINEGCLIYLDEPTHRVRGKMAKGRHWYCDALAVNLKAESAFLCEVTYASGLALLAKRLDGWATHWPQVRQALARDSAIPTSWAVKPWVFVPRDLHPRLNKRLEKITGIAESTDSMPAPMVTYLEDVVPWNYNAINGNPCEADRAA